MAQKEINPILKQVLELGPTLVFFLIYLRIRDNVYTWGGTEYSGFIVATIVRADPIGRDGDFVVPDR